MGLDQGLRPVVREWVRVDDRSDVFDSRVGRVERVTELDGDNAWIDVRFPRSGWRRRYEPWQLRVVDDALDGEEMG
ncbi:MAG: hypothetical protein KGR26_06890 [Cyanobacteria bacterium REEB65]|nr:hypothetical protein [Cyanobacteria bacterium REEB65]